MRKLLNTLYITSPDAYLSRENETIAIRIGEEVKAKIPIHNLEGVVTFGYTGASPALMNLCVERGVALSFMSQNGKFLARVTGKTNGNVLLRRKQYHIADDAITYLAYSKSFIFGKIYNSRAVLSRFAREHNGEAADEVRRATDHLARQLHNLDRIEDVGRLRGTEGEAARDYYSVFDHLILENKSEFQFRGRSRRPPRDLVNAMLSFLYTLLAHDCAAALETVGLDPSVGFLHKEHPGRPSLALDMMEELRPYLVDRTVLSLINNRQIRSKDFLIKENSAVLLKDDARKLVLETWQKRKQETIKHPFLKEKIEIGLIPYSQALLLARTVRGDLELYPPFLMK